MQADIGFSCINSLKGERQEEVSVNAITDHQGPKEVEAGRQVQEVCRKYARL
jgi:hypothetical protein